MKMKIVDNKFYVVNLLEEKWVHDTKDDAIDTLANEIKKTPTLKPEDANIIEVDTSTEKWGLTMVPWAEISFSLIRGESDGSKAGTD